MFECDLVCVCEGVGIALELVLDGWRRKEVGRREGGRRRRRAEGVYACTFVFASMHVCVPVIA
jgi:hypothetical protein